MKTNQDLGGVEVMLVLYARGGRMNVLDRVLRWRLPSPPPPPAPSPHRWHFLSLTSRPKKIISTINLPSRMNVAPSPASRPSPPLQSSLSLFPHPSQFFSYYLCSIPPISPLSPWHLRFSCSTLSVTFKTSSWVYSQRPMPPVSTRAFLYVPIFPLCLPLMSTYTSKIR